MPEALPGEPSGSNGNARLDLLVTGAFRILRRIDERRDARFLIVLEHELPRDRRREEETDTQYAEHAHRHAGEIGHGEEHGHQGYGRAQIRLLRNQREGNEGQPAADCEVHPRRRAAILAEELGEHQGDSHLSELGRLKVDEFQENPAARAHLHMAEKQDVDEQREEADVNQVRLVGEGAVVEGDREHHRTQADRDGVELRDVHARRGAGRGRIGRRAVDHHEPERAECDDRDDERPVDVMIELAFEHYCAPVVATAALRASGSRKSRRRSVGAGGKGRPSFLAKNVSST